MLIWSRSTRSAARSACAANASRARPRSSNRADVERVSRRRPPASPPSRWTGHPDPVTSDIDDRGVVDDAGPAITTVGAGGGPAADVPGLRSDARIEQEDVDDHLVPGCTQQVDRLPAIEEAAGGHLIGHRVHERTVGRVGPPGVVPALVPDQVAGARAPVAGLDGVLARVDIGRIVHHLNTQADLQV